MQDSNMGLLDWWSKKTKPLSRMTRDELRGQEMLLNKDRSQLLKRIEKIAAAKQALFERGAKEKTPEVRRVLAQEFEVKTSEQLMLARRLNIRSKEALTVTRLRLLRENADQASRRGRLALVREQDLMKLQRLIERDSISAEMYLQRLDQILSLGAEADAFETRQMAPGQQVLDIWEQMDRGLIRDPADGFEEADRRVREDQAAEGG